MNMRKVAVRILPISTVLGMAGLLVAGALVTNCGGSQGVRTGTAGNAGTAGTTGSAGTGPGTAGTTGSAGTVGTGGAAFSCSPASVLDCTGPGLVTFHASDGTITSFSTQEWSSGAGKFCDATGLRGAIYGYNDGMTAVDGGAVSTNGQTVDTSGTRTLNLTWTAEPAGWAGGGLSFDSCVNADAFNALQFMATVTSGSMTGCAFQVGLATQDERPTTQTMPPGGTCDSSAGSCYRYPTVSNLADPTTSGMTYTLPFSTFTTAATLVVPAQKQIVGIQWQVNSAAPTVDGGSQVPCVVTVAVDDIKFVTM
jgi:hypothetical protein